MKKHSWLVNLRDYAPLIGEEAAERIERKAQRLRGIRVLHVSSTSTAAALPSCCRPKPCLPAAWASEPTGG